MWRQGHQPALEMDVNTLTKVVIGKATRGSGNMVFDFSNRREVSQLCRGADANVLPRK
jgi:hypothetical protein